MTKNKELGCLTLYLHTQGKVLAIENSLLFFMNFVDVFKANFFLFIPYHTCVKYKVWNDYKIETHLQT